MAHKTLIDGTSYEVTGGRTLVDGTGYDVTGGRTLVDGTGYDVGFGVTWAVYSVETVFVYDGTYTTKTVSATLSNIYCKDSNYTYIWKSDGAPVALNGTYSERVEPPWANTFTRSGYSGGSVPFTFENDGYYMFYKSDRPLLSRIYKITAGTSVTRKNDTDYLGLGASSKEYTANMVETSVKGTTQYDNVTAPEGTYPDNGEQDGKWYVRLT